MMTNNMLYNFMVSSDFAGLVSVANLTLVVMGLIIIIRHIIEAIVLRNEKEI